jgi:predicted enzyme involved in methoxymalonyl-ACP biosynthesis
MLMSCRVLNRGVEHAMLREVGALALAQGLSQVHPYQPETYYADVGLASFPT